MVRPSGVGSCGIFCVCVVARMADNANQEKGCVMTTRDALTFVAHCIGQAEAEGYQQFEDDTNNVPDDATPSEYWIDNKEKTLELHWGDEVFVATFRKQKRKVGA